MEQQHSFLEIIQKAQRSLDPYIKQRQEAAQIRRILASHLSSHVHQNRGISLPRPLSLVGTGCEVDGTSHGVRGLQKEYLRCVRANVKAKAEYDEISRQHQRRLEDGGRELKGSSSIDGVASSLKCFIDLVSQRQKHERLRIIQDYVDVLAQKPAATLDHLDPQMVLKDVEALPKMPSEVLNGSGPIKNPAAVDLKELVDQLEKSVLRAKMLLQREQNLLAKIKTEDTTITRDHGTRLSAVGTTRSTLINWIESELSRAGEGNPESCSLNTSSPDKRGKHFIASELLLIQRQYKRYTKARESLVTAATDLSVLPDAPVAEIQTSMESSELYCICSGMEITHPYLEEMISISNEQKAVIQQKSHLTISLSKQLKEANQGLDRLAEESHLLPTYPMPAVRTQRNGPGGPVSFGDEISNHQELDSSSRARAWMYAAQSSSYATGAIVSDKLDEGRTTLNDAQRVLLELQDLLGLEIRSGDRSGTQQSRDIWAVLHGNLGVIKGDGMD
ncbi:uncharacterized protein RAG0_01876 [Rhynchosporium agropyri]|uniref:Uncharacterized protein n=1 Tax=Rhynchosporium agropyri TaxID=914238 RepID=A0A1E1JZB5_9HELO|nr:uncharacterized protein RAG0_01876 [Rhynchosporium agropyri]